MTMNSRYQWLTGLALLAAAGLLVGVFFWPGSAPGPRPRPPGDAGVLRVACSQVLVPDPFRRIFPMPPQNQFILSLWEPLVECDPATGEPQPAAAAAWEWSEDHLALTLRLQPDGRWSNGEPVTAADFVRGWRRLLRQNLSLAHTLFPVKNAAAYHHSATPEEVPLGLTAVDAHTLRVELAALCPSFVARLADPLLSPLHEATAEVLTNQTYLTEPARLLTNGPFRLEAYRREGPRLVASPHYHGRADVRLAGIQFVQAASLSAAPLLLASGQADLLSLISPNDPHQPPGTRPLVMHSEPTLAISLWEFNLSRPFLRETRVRRALSLALDRAAAIPPKEASHLVPALAWVPSLPGRPSLELIREDADEARRLLAEAGFPGGTGLPVLVLVLPASMQGNPHPVAWSERWFHQLGVRTRLVYETRELMYQRLKAGDYDLAYQTLIATVPEPGDMLDYFTWPQDELGTKWIDPELSSLLAKADKQQGAERLACLEKAERRIIAEMGVIPLMFYRRQSLLGAEVRGWYSDPLARHSLKRLWLDETATPGRAATEQL